MSSLKKLDKQIWQGCESYQVLVPVKFDVRDGVVVSVQHPAFEDVQAAYDAALADQEAGPSPVTP
jgi:hypothetical protein